MRPFLFLFISFLVIFSGCCRSIENNSDKPNDVKKINRQFVDSNDTTIKNNTSIEIFHIDKQQKVRAYSLILNNVIDEYQNSGFLRAVDIECIIPRTKFEFFIYYKGRQNENDVVGHKPFYHYCDSLCSLYAIRDSLNIFYAYLNLYQVMDCQIADESYCTRIFNGIEDAIYANKQKFDELYQSFDAGLKIKYDCFNWR